MDVRRFAFLARQPSARLQPREHFCGLPKRGLALLLANVMFWQPLWAQAAEGVAVSAPGTSLGQAGNGVPIVNIAAPNGRGLSHNQFSDYNVGQQGLILNNATERTQATQLGGIILGNPNLQGAAASTILNEVNGANPSQLRGYTEVAGQSARVIVANPHGITCNGCGFINTPQVTLSTGKPVIDNGQLSRYQVDQGSVTIEGAGLNAGNVDRFEIITRSAKVNAEIQARQLAIIAGRNDVDAQTLAATARADDGSAKPQLAIDSSALGGMYAGAIKLVGTEAGVGVRLAGDVAASGGDLQLDANGKVTMTQASSTGNLTVKAAQLELGGKTYAAGDVDLRSASELANRQSLAASGQVRLEAGHLSNSGVIEAGVEPDNSRNGRGDVSLFSQNMTNSGQIVAGRDLSVTVAQTFDNRGGALQGERQRTSVMHLDNRKGKVLAAQTLEVNSVSVDNRDGGALNSQGSATVTTAGLLDNRGGQVIGVQGLRVSAAELNNAGKGLVASEGQLNLDATDLGNQGGTLSAARQQVHVSRLDNREGTLVGKAVELSAQSIDNRQGRIVANDGQMRVRAEQQLDNRDGTLQASGHVQVDGGALSNRGGTVLGTSIGLDLARLDNGLGGKVIADSGALQLDARGAVDNQQGLLRAAAAVTVNAASVDNRAGVVVGHQVKADVGEGVLDNRGGQLLGTRLELAAQRLDNRDQGQVLAGSDGLKVTASTLSNQQGTLLAGGALAELLLGSGRLDNQQGSLVASAIRLGAADVDNSAGALTSLDGNLQLTVQRLVNRNGLIEASQALLVDGQRLDNRSGGRVISHAGMQTRLVLDEQLDNRGGRVASASTDLLLQVPSLLNQGGTLEHAAQGQLQLRAAHLSSALGKINGLGDATWTLGSVDGIGTWHLNGNLDISGLQSIALSAGERIASAGDLRLAGQSLSNAGELLSDGKLTLQVTGDMANQGLISALRGLRIDARHLTQEGGRIASGAPLVLALSGNLSNLGRLTGTSTLDITAANLVNQGTLGAQGKVSLRVDGMIDNQQDSLLFAGADLDLRSTSLLNRYADIYSKGDLRYTALDGGKAGSLRNLSGSIESERNIDLKVTTLENAKADFEPDKVMTGRSIRINCTDCSGDHHTATYIVTTTYKGTVLRDSPAARLLANQDLLLDTVTVINGQSLLAANRNLRASAQNFYNRGQTLDNSIEEDTYWLLGVSQGAFRVAEADTIAWNKQNAGLPPEQQAPIPSSVTQYRYLGRNTRVLPGTDTAFTGTVQAGGTLSLNVSGELVNGTLEPHANAQLTGKALDSAAVEAGEVRVTLGTQAGDPGPLKDVKRVETIAADGTTQVSFIPVDFSGAPFVSIDPTVLPGFRLPQGDYGLFVRSRNPASSYLIETNPELTDPSRFMASSYLLGNLGFDPDQAARRLGDGRYETRLIAEAVRAQTGQRFLADGLNSDYDQFKYLMDNAVASKDALGLSLGVGLTAQQVAALTHDIVWMESRVVDGQTVLAPVLYLAKVDARNLRGGSLMQGRDLNLVTGGDLRSVGTLRASNDLSAAVGGSLYQGGLVQANQRLGLMAQDSIRNALAGEIRGNQVSLVSLTGDIVNDRTATEVSVGSGRATRVDVGSVISARDSLTFDAAGDLTNKARLESGGDLTAKAGGDINLLAVEDRTLSLQAIRGGLRTEETVRQLGSRVTAGGGVALQAGRDINIVASGAHAEQQLQARAEGDINLIAGEDLHSVESASKRGRKKTQKLDEQSSLVGASLSAGGSLGVSAGQDVNLLASGLLAKDSAYLYAGNDVNVLAGQEVSHAYFAQQKKGSFGRRSSRMSESESSVVVSSVIQGGKSVDLVAARDANIQASQVIADKGELAVTAGRDVKLLAGESTHASASAKSKSGGLGLSTTSKANSQSTTYAVVEGSTLSGNTTLVQAGRDISLSAANVVSTEKTTLTAANDVRIDTAVETLASHSSQTRTKSGLMSSGGIGVTLGTAKNSSTKDTNTTSHRGSTVGSILGDMQVQAGKDLSIRSSDVVAGKDVSLLAQNVSIEAAQGHSTSEEAHKSSKTGLTLALSGAVGSAINTTYQNTQATRSESDSRLSALQGIKAGLSGFQAMQAAEALKSGAQQGEFVGIALSVGAQKSSSSQRSEQFISQGSSVTAGNNLSIVASGNGALGTEGDILVQGSQLKSGKDLLMAANRDVDLRAAANTQTLDGKNKSGGGAVGISLGLGNSGANLSIFANANTGRGGEKGNGTTWNETTVDAGNVLMLASGRDTRLTGAQVNAEQVQAKIGRDLLVHSLQDSDRYDSKQLDVAGGASLNLGSGGSGYLAINHQKLHSNYDSVQQQSGLFAGKGGYDIEVGKHTQLDGAVIASTATPDKNRLSTETLGWTELRNKAEFKTQGQNLSLSGGGEFGDAFQGNMGSVMAVGINRSGSASGTTHSAVAQGTLDVRDPASQQQDLAALSRDPASANGSISPIFDKEKEQRRLRTVQLIGEIGSQAMDIIRTEGDLRAFEAGKRAVGERGSESASDYAEKVRHSSVYQDAMQRYGTGSDLQRAAQAVTAALQGLAGGNLAGALAGASAPYLAQQIKQVAGDNDAARLMAHAVLGALVAQVQGSGAAAGAAGAVTGELIATRLYPGKPPSELSEEEKQTVSALATLASGLAGAVAGGDGSGALAGAQAGKNAVENNHLTLDGRMYLVQKERQFAQECPGGAGSSGACQALADKIGELRKLGESVLEHETVAVASDMGPDISLTHKPGDLVPCATANGYCRVSHEVVETAAGKEWKLVAVSDAEAAGAKQKNLMVQERRAVEAKQWLASVYAEGCGGLGLVGAGCQLLVTAGASNPITGEVPETGERLLAAATLALNMAGLYGGVGAKATGAAGESAGAMRRLDYEAAPYHGKVDNAVKSRAPVNGQEALDFSIQVKPTSPRRVGIDYDSKEFVVFDKTLDTTYHGHVRSWSDLHPDMQKALQQAGMADRKGNILTGGKR
ncbi:hemagglutinin repeat-containing protein [Pseudomonas sp. RW10S2]|uniref:hemagglutinin repeat-containing protein n=1 Tax=Pseudomonas sp. RW10S2 TaxID=459637 RepID=UPI0016445CBA|nr:hemagglutinin repeat-containing protein [Pseudomonas sp. RW10S2]MBC3467377.1 hemagglutinin repeat-containing protein [Pseudomonas sp. RW10S2]